MLNSKYLISGFLLSLFLCQSASAASIFGLQSNPKECKQVYKDVVCEVNILLLVAEIPNKLSLSEYNKLLDPLKVDITIDTTKPKLDPKKYPLGMYGGMKNITNCFYDVYKSSVNKDGSVSMVSDKNTRTVTSNLGHLMIISPTPLVPGKSSVVVFNGKIDVCIKNGETWYTIHGLASTPSGNTKIKKF